MSSVAGCAMSIVGNIIVSLSLNIQRLAHKKLDAEAESPSDADANIDAPQRQGNYLKSAWWWLGIILMALGETGNFLAYAFAPASVVATLGTTGLIANVFFAPLIFKERFRKIDLLGVTIAIVGGIVVVLSAQAEQPKLSPEQILQAISQRSFLVYFGMTMLMLGILVYLSPRYGEQYILIDLGCVALCGGYTALSTKGVSSLLSILFYKALEYPIFYFLLAILISTAILQVRYLNRSLARFDSTRVIPCQFCTFTISTIVGSAILYRDFEKMEATTIASFVLGGLLTFLGVWVMSTDKNDTKESDVTSPISATQRMKRTIDTVLREQTPLLAELLPNQRPQLAQRMHSSNAQSGPLVTYFVTKADNNRQRNNFNSASYQSSHGGSFLRPNDPVALHATSV